jgi:hypothetical protein
MRKKDDDLYQQLNILRDLAGNVDTFPEQYPKEIPMANFAWDARKFTCPCCITVVRSKNCAIYQNCYHVICDKCKRSYEKPNCPKCNLPAGLLRESEPFSDSSSSAEAEDAEEESSSDDTEEEKVPENIKEASKDELIVMV